MIILVEKSWDNSNINSGIFGCKFIYIYGIPFQPIFVSRLELTFSNTPKPVFIILSNVLAQFWNHHHFYDLLFPWFCFLFWWYNVKIYIYLFNRLRLVKRYRIDKYQSKYITEIFNRDFGFFNLNFWKLLYKQMSVYQMHYVGTVPDEPIDICWCLFAI